MTTSTLKWSLLEVCVCVCMRVLVCLSPTVNVFFRKGPPGVCSSSGLTCLFRTVERNTHTQNTNYYGDHGHSQINACAHILKPAHAHTDIILLAKKCVKRAHGSHMPTGPGGPMLPELL